MRTDALKPRLEDGIDLTQHDFAVQVSIAVSLKRIADAIAGTQDGKNSGILHAVHDLVK